uniref:WLGC domain-containing protein n=1 Tax=Globisporangium ultimum (strain ATCC 200006 / CBS 805.95 / DAOM BR144) TaxID=431595 RepID=K3WCD1_GLOUD
MEAAASPKVQPIGATSADFPMEASSSPKVQPVGTLQMDNSMEALSPLKLQPACATSARLSVDTPSPLVEMVKALSVREVQFTTRDDAGDLVTLRYRASKMVEPRATAGLHKRRSQSLCFPNSRLEAPAPAKNFRRHSLGTTRPRPTTVHFVREKGDGFYDVFGALGIPMILAFLLSAGAIFNQAYIQMYPSEYANMLMNTTNYDDGKFWLLNEIDSSTVAIATALLVFFGCLYLVLVVYMIFFRHLAIETKKRVPRDPKQTDVSKCSSARESTASEVEGDITVTEIAKGVLATNLAFMRDAVLEWLPCLKPRLQKPSEIAATTSQRKSAALTKKNIKRARAIYFQFSDIDGTYHAYYSAMYDIPKLAFQTATLFTYLRKGFPTSMVAFYCTMLSFNWLISFYRFQRKTFDKALIVARIFYIFDLFFAVFAPVLILINSYNTFHFGREVYQTKEESLPPGAVDRTARLFADPDQFTIIRLAFGHLTLTSGSTIGIKCGLLYLSIYKWRKIIRFLIQSNHKTRRQLKESHSTKQRKQTRHHLLFGVVLFLMFGAGTLIYTIGALVSCNANCSDQPHCVAISYNWYVGRKGCPCLVYINRRLDPRTYDEWLNPEDATESLAKAAVEGELISIQIINRALSTLPDALHNCKHLQQLILIYTETERFPDWITNLTYLEYLHIEGDFTLRGLKYMPPTMFSRMHKLHYIHTGTIPLLQSYPSLTGLGQLQSLSIVSAHSLVEIPPLDDLKSLNSLNFAELYQVSRLPALSALTDLRRFNVLFRNKVCCNGYMAGNCDRSKAMCRGHVEQCVSEPISAADREIISQTQGEICSDVPFNYEDLAPTLESTDVACGGVLYRQCQVGNSTGICYTAQMQVVTCDTTGYYEKMRRFQIDRNVGDPCDPEKEAWLGCQ